MANGFAVVVDIYIDNGTVLESLRDGHETYANGMINYIEDNQYNRMSLKGKIVDYHKFFLGGNTIEFSAADVLLRMFGDKHYYAELFDFIEVTENYIRLSNRREEIAGGVIHPANTESQVGRLLNKLGIKNSNIVPLENLLTNGFIVVPDVNYIDLFLNMLNMDAIDIREIITMSRIYKERSKTGFSVKVYACIAVLMAIYAYKKNIVENIWL